VIEQAKGIIMGERRCTSEEAFDALVRMSQDTNRKLREVAQDLVNQVGGWTARTAVD
jgi:AmiR/NasT family two-component response regulator